jgi:hypothetical protein
MTRPDRRGGVLAVVLALLPVSIAAPDDPGPGEAESALLRLVPPDAGLTLAALDLRGHAREIAESKLARAFWALPAVKQWRTSDAGLKFRRARDHIERTLGVPLTTIRDDLLGDAVVLSLHLAPGAAPDSARGLLLTRVRDKALLTRLVDFFNRASGAEVSEAGADDRRYSIRKFPGLDKEPDYYRLLDDGTFAWSNSEALIRDVLDRRAGVGKPGLGDDPRFKKVRAGLPGRTLLASYVDPRFAARVLEAAPKSGTPGDDRTAELVGRYLRTVEGVGLALEWRGGALFHVHETYDPAGLDPRLVRWAKSGSSPDALARRIPETAVAAAAAPIDLAATGDALVELVPLADRPRLDMIFEALRGVLLGRDLRAEVLPRLGPAVVAYVEGPSDGSGSAWLPVVGAVELRDDGGEHGVAAALDNALRTLLCLYALDPRHNAAALRVESRRAGPLRVVSLGGSNAPFAYGLGPNYLVVGTSADAVARFGTAPADTRLAPFKARYFPNARAYAAVDVARLARAAQSHREPLAQRVATARGVTPEAAARDLDAALALLDLFDAAFAALAVDPNLTSVHQTFGLVGR